MQVNIRELVAQAKAPSRGRQRPARILSAFPFLLPAILFYGTFVLYPMVNALRLSFFEWNGFSGSEMTFVGLDNYVSVMTRDPVFWTAARNSLVWVVLSLLVPTSLGLAVALALNQGFPGRNAFRTFFYLPAVLASIAVATMWRWMYNPNFGVVNYIFSVIGISRQTWLAQPRTAIFAIFAASVWVAAGANMVLFLAGLQTVPRELVEAARVDGAGVWQVFRNVTVPALRPTLIIVIALTVINSLKVFDLVVGMTNGGPAQSTQVLALWSYTQSFGNHKFGEGNAIATILLGVTLLVIVPYLLWTLREEGA